MSNETSIIALPGKATATKTGLIFSNGISYDEWEELGFILATIGNAHQWWIGDWANFGEQKFWQFSQAIGEELGLDYQAIANAKWVSNKFADFSTRVEKLSWSHHREVAGIEDIEERQKYMELAVKNGWLAREFRKKIKEHKRSQLAEQASEIEDSDRYILYHGDILEQGENIEDESIDLILTDPPYPKEYIHLWSDLGVLAERVLRPSAYLIAYSGQTNLLDVMQRLSEHLDYYWTMNLVHSGNNQLVGGRNVITGWKPLLIFQKSPFKRKDFSFHDVLEGSGREKELHDWAQAIDELDYLIDNFSDPGHLILDPFAGSGTTIMGAMKNNRKAIGIEIDEEKFKIANWRVNEYLQVE